MITNYSLNAHLTLILK